jgi:hypothetical protein
MPPPDLTFLSQTGEPEVVVVEQLVTNVVNTEGETEVVTLENSTVELLTIFVQGQKGDPGVGDVENAILDGGTFN